MNVDKYTQLKRFVKLLVEDGEIALPELFGDWNRPSAGAQNTAPTPQTPEESAAEEVERLKRRLRIEEAKVRLFKNMRIAKAFVECDDLIMSTLSTK